MRALTKQLGLYNLWVFFVLATLVYLLRKHRLSILKTSNRAMLVVNGPRRALTLHLRAKRGSWDSLANRTTSLG